MADEPQPGETERQGRNWGGWAMLVLVALLLVFVLQNFQEVRIDFLVFTSVRMPLILALAVAALLGALIAWLAARFQRD